MAKIDGEAIRRLREAKGLTQLYVATAVGVTTDTISRWENRRYPSIKNENALKLAGALEVEPAAILEKAAPEEPGPEAPAAAPPVAGGGRRRQWPLLAGLAVILLAVAGAWLVYGTGPRPRAEAARLLPPHAPPGQTFPVVIRIVGGQGEASPLILKEELPAAAAVLQGKPAFTGFDRQEKILKWIGKTGEEPVYFAYLAQTLLSAAPGEDLRFWGQVTLRGGRGATIDIGGGQSLQLAPYHWADTNKDYRIDDEEILTVYETLGDFEEIGFDRELIESIWAADGYRWDLDTASYEIER